MGAKDWMLFYASDDVSKVLRAAPKIDREATAAFVERLYPYAIWEPDGTLRRAYSLSPDSGVIADVGTHLPFEEKYRAGDPEFLESLDSDDEYPFRFHPLDLAEAALRELFGFNYEGAYEDDDPELEDVVLAGYAVTPR